MAILSDVSTKRETEIINTPSFPNNANNVNCAWLLVVKS